MMVRGRGQPVPTTFAGLADSVVGANADRITDFSHVQGKPDRSGGAIDAKLTVLSTGLSASSAAPLHRHRRAVALSGRQRGEP
jgi:hypothetical protein